MKNNLRKNNFNFFFFFYSVFCFYATLPIYRRGKYSGVYNTTKDPCWNCLGLCISKCTSLKDLFTEIHDHKHTLKFICWINSEKLSVMWTLKVTWKWSKQSGKKQCLYLMRSNQDVLKNVCSHIQKKKTKLLFGYSWKFLFVLLAVICR